MGNGRKSGLPRGIRDVSDRIDLSQIDLTKFKMFRARLDPTAPDTDFLSDEGKTAQWFQDHSNFNDLAMKIVDSKEDRAAIDAWTDGEFMDGQQYKGFSSMDAEHQAWTRSLDNMIDQSVIYRDVVVSRLSDWKQLGGVKTPQELDRLVGTETVILGHHAASAADQGLSIGNVDKNVEYRYYIPGGTKGAAMWIGDDSINWFGDAQRETIVNRDSVFTISGYHYDTARNVYVVDLLWKKKLPHNYN